MPGVRVDDMVDVDEVVFLIAITMDERWLSLHARDRKASHHRVTFASLIAAGYPPRSMDHEGQDHGSLGSG